MGLRISWSSRTGWRLTETAHIGRLRVWESVPLGKRTKNGRRRRTRKGASIRL